MDSSTPRAPSTAAVSVRTKLREGLALARHHVGRLQDEDAVAGVFRDIDEYRGLYARFTGDDLADASIFEIGFGARPFRLLALRALGYDVSGVDAERPLLNRAGPKAFLGILRANGAERALKTAIRFTLFDRRERRLFERELRARAVEPRIEPQRLIVSDAAKLDRPNGTIDLIYSEDVFEHIALAPLEAVVGRMAAWLRPGGIALVRPNIWTGITGGHLIEWNQRSFETGRPRRSSPWDHLREKRFEANTYLNRLSRQDYRDLFGRYFTIEEEVERLPGLGQEFLTLDVRAELGEYSNDELFSNQVMFVLRRKSEINTGIQGRKSAINTEIQVPRVRRQHRDPDGS